MDGAGARVTTVAAHHVANKDGNMTNLSARAPPQPMGQGTAYLYDIPTNVGSEIIYSFKDSFVHFGAKIEVSIPLKILKKKTLCFLLPSKPK